MGITYFYLPDSRLGFGKGSRRNENFKVASFPNFLLVNKSGGVEKMIGGYDKEVGKILF